MIHDSRRLEPWRQQAVALMRHVAPTHPLGGPVGVAITIFQERPLAHYVARRRERGLRADAPRLPVAGRDLDKVARACLDACTQACWWRDDSQVAWLLVARFYADGRGECVRISAWEL